MRVTPQRVPETSPSPPSPTLNSFNARVTAVWQRLRSLSTGCVAADTWVAFATDDLGLDRTAAAALYAAFGGGSLAGLAGGLRPYPILLDACVALARLRTAEEDATALRAEAARADDAHRAAAAAAAARRTVVPEADGQAAQAALRAKAARAGLTPVRLRAPPPPEVLAAGSGGGGAFEYPGSESLDAFARRVEELWRGKEGTVLDELAANLKAPVNSTKQQRVASAALCLADRDGGGGGGGAQPKQAMAAAQRQQEEEPAERCAVALYDALHGVGAASAAAVLESGAAEAAAAADVPNCGGGGGGGAAWWHAVEEAFAAAYPREVGGGGAAAAMAARLPADELRACQGVLARCGVGAESLEAGGRGGNGEEAGGGGIPPEEAAVVRLVEATAGCGWSEELVAALGAHLGSAAAAACREALGSPPGSPAARRAARLYKAMKVLSSDEAEVYEVVEGMEGQAEWDAVRAEFRATYPKTGDGDLVRAMREQLSREELRRCRAILEAKGVALESGDPAAASAQGSTLAGAEGLAEAAACLYRATKGGAAGGTALGLLKDIASRAEQSGGAAAAAAWWGGVREAFAAAYPRTAGGDVVRALDEGLSAEENNGCREVLGRWGVAAGADDDEQAPPLCAVERLALHLHALTPQDVDALMGYADAPPEDADGACAADYRSRNPVVSRAVAWALRSAADGREGAWETVAQWVKLIVLLLAVAVDSPGASAPARLVRALPALPGGAEVAAEGLMLFWPAATVWEATTAAGAASPSATAAATSGAPFVVEVADAPCGVPLALGGDHEDDATGGGDVLSAATSAVAGAVLLPPLLCLEVVEVVAATEASATTLRAAWRGPPDSLRCLCGAARAEAQAASGAALEAQAGGARAAAVHATRLSSAARLGAARAAAQRDEEARRSAAAEAARGVRAREAEARRAEVRLAELRSLAEAEAAAARALRADAAAAAAEARALERRRRAAAERAAALAAREEQERARARAAEEGAAVETERLEGRLESAEAEVALLRARAGRAKLEHRDAAAAAAAAERTRAEAAGRSEGAEAALRRARRQVEESCGKDLAERRVLVEQELRVCEQMDVLRRQEEEHLGAMRLMKERRSAAGEQRVNGDGGAGGGAGDVFQHP